MTDKPDELDYSHLSGALKAGLTDWDDAANLILSMSQAMIRRVPEEYFTAKVLPIIRAWVQGIPVEVGQWMNVADGMENEIIVVDSKNVELFICPPPFIPMPPKSEFGEKNRGSAFAVVHAQGLMYDAGEIRQGNAIDEALFELVVEKPDIAIKTAAIDKMIYIYQRYDLPMVELLGSHTDEIMKARGAPVKAATESKAIPDEEDTLIY
jgi:hypothetical protein